jgi:hypothetical protein
VKTPFFEDREFCRDAFAEALPAEFREGAISGMTRAARAKKRERRGGVMVAIALVVGSVFLLSEEKPVVMNGPVLAQQHEPGWFVRTGALPNEVFVHSAPLPSGLLVENAVARFEVISDEQLIALAPNHSLGLIRTPGGVELVFPQQSLFP